MLPPNSIIYIAIAIISCQTTRGCKLLDLSASNELAVVEAKQFAPRSALRRSGEAFHADVLNTAAEKSD
jgi:hypothetical protein